MGGKVVMASWVFILWLVVLMGFAVAIPIVAKRSSPNVVELRARRLLLESPGLIQIQLHELLEGRQREIDRLIDEGQSARAAVYAAEEHACYSILLDEDAPASSSSPSNREILILRTFPDGAPQDTYLDWLRMKYPDWDPEAHAVTRELMSNDGESEDQNGP
jgi:hypothetical protein